MEDEHLYLGTSETRGMLMVCPSLASFVSEQLRADASVLKERRKLREERLLNRDKEAKPGQVAETTKHMQSLIDKQKAEIRKLKDQPGGDYKGPKNAKKSGQGAAGD